jgi:hypothetical protein
MLHMAKEIKPKAEGEPIAATFTLVPEGDVTITVPDGLSVQSITDLDGHLKIFLDGLKRAATPPTS